MAVVMTVDFERRGGRGSSPDLRHRPRCSSKAGIVDLVLELFVTYCVANELDQLVVGGACAERGLEIPFAAREEAGAELAVGGEPDAVAARAERLRHRVDEAQLAGAVGEAVATRRGRRFRRQLLEGPVPLLDDRADLPARKDVVFAPGLVRVEGHELDE